MVEIRAKTPTELDRVTEVDVSERGDIVFYFAEGDIIAQTERWQRPTRT